MPDVRDIMDALAAQIAANLSAVDGLQVHARLLWNPTPPAIDIYPGTPFQEGIAMREKALYFTVRARVNTPDHEGAQDLLLDLMDPDSANSVEDAIRVDPTLGGVVEYAAVASDSPSEFGAFTDPGGEGFTLIGCTWRVQVLP